MVQPLKFFGGTRSVRRQVLGSWLLAAIYSIPQLMVMVQTEERRLLPDASRYVIAHKCKGTGYTSTLQRKIHFTFQTLSFLVVPAGIMVYCYAKVTRAIWSRAGAQRAGDIDRPRVHFVTSRGRAQPASGSAVDVELVGSAASPHPPRSDGSVPPPPPPTSRHCLVMSVPRRMIFNTKLNVVRMSMTVTVGFLVCFTPFFVISLIRVYSDYRYTMRVAVTVTKLMTLAHSAVNPVLYLIFSTRAVRATFVQLCQPCCRRLRRRDHGQEPFPGQQPSNRSPRALDVGDRSMNSADGSRRSAGSERARSRRREQESAPEALQLAGRSGHGRYELGNRATWDAVAALRYS